MRKLGITKLTVSAVFWWLWWKWLVCIIWNLGKDKSWWFLVCVCMCIMCCLGPEFIQSMCQGKMIVCGWMTVLRTWSVVCLRMM